MKNWLCAVHSGLLMQAAIPSDEFTQFAICHIKYTITKPRMEMQGVQSLLIIPSNYLVDWLFILASIVLE